MYDVTIPCESNVFMWLHIQSAKNMEITVWIYRCYILITDVIYVMMDLPLVTVAGVLVWLVLSGVGISYVMCHRYVGQGV